MYGEVHVVHNLMLTLGNEILSMILLKYYINVLNKKQLLYWDQIDNHSRTWILSADPHVLCSSPSSDRLSSLSLADLGM